MTTGQSPSVWTQIDIGSTAVDDAHSIRETILAALDDRYVLFDGSEPNASGSTTSPDLVIAVDRSSLSLAAASI